MAAPIKITRLDLGPAGLRREARRASSVAASRRMLALALVLEGVTRTEAAQVAGMERQTLRDWVHRYNKQPLACYGIDAPRLPAGNDGIGVDEELSGAGDESSFVRLAARGEAPVESFEGWVPMKGRRQRRRVKRTAEPGSASDDVALAVVSPTVLVEGREAGEGRGLFAGDTAEFGQAQQDGKRRAFADAGHALDQIEAGGEIGMLAYLPNDFEEFGGSPGLQAADVAGDDAAQAGVGDMFETGFEAGDILFELLDEGELVGQGFQAAIDLTLDWIERCGAGGDEGRIDGIVLGAAQVQPGEGFDLHGLKHEDRDTLGPERACHASFVAAGGFDADTGDPGFAKRPHEAFEAGA
jgi:Homeodomain-like domain